MMEQLFDEEVMRKQYDIASRRAAREEGRMEGFIKGFIEGFLEGEQIGLAKGLAKAAEQMRRSGLSEEQIEAILSQC